MAEKYVPIFYDWIEATRELNAQEKGRLIDALVIYARGGDWQDQIKGNERYAFPIFQLQIDRFKAVAEQRATNRDKTNKLEQKEQTGTKTHTNTNTNTNTKSNTNTKNDTDTDNDDGGGNIARAEAYAAQTLLNLSGGNLEELADFAQHLPDDIIRWAVDESAAAGKPYWTYCRAILRKCVERGYKTLAEVKAAESKRQKGGVIGGIGTDDYKPIPGGVNL